MAEQVEVFFGSQLQPKGEHVLLKFEKDLRELISNGGIIEAGGEAKSRYIARVWSVGNKISLDEWDFNIGDRVIFNNYDIKYLEEHKSKQLYGMVKPQSIMATYAIDE